VNLDLVKTSELFLVPSSFLVAALGTADTNYHKAAVSLLGLVVSVVWLWCSREARAEIPDESVSPRQIVRLRALEWFPLVFIVGWLVSAVVHVWLVSGS
jgi:hypothetical protein